MEKEKIKNKDFIKIKKKYGENFEINTAELTARLSNNLYFVKIKDSTEYEMDFETLAAETSLKGVFVKNMLLKLETAENKQTIKNALKLGLKAFNGEVKYNED